MDDLISRYYKISSYSEEQLNMLEKFFVYIQYLSVIGASREVHVYVDGDGAVNLKFASHSEGEFLFNELDFQTVMKKDNGYGSVKLGDNNYDSKFDLG